MSKSCLGDPSIDQLLDEEISIIGLKSCNVYLSCQSIVVYATVTASYRNQPTWLKNY